MKKIFIFFIRAYQVALSPVLPPSCRFEPSCSHYAIEAISRYGVLRGLVIALRRIMRCHPWCAGGYDPIEDNGLFICEKRLKRGS